MEKTYTIKLNENEATLIEVFLGKSSKSDIVRWLEELSLDMDAEKLDRALYTVFDQLNDVL